MTEDRRERNKNMRRDYLSALADSKKAQDNADEFEATRLRQKADDIANDFVKANKALVSQAGHFLQGVNREDHEAAAILGLWEAFVGTDASRSQEIDLDDDGKVAGTNGWDPDAGTFATYSRRHITGRAGRSVAGIDTKYQGLSYSTFQSIPAVKQARDFLKLKLEREPSHQEIANQANVTVATVRTALVDSPKSLDAPVGEDGATFGELNLTDKSNNIAALADGVTPKWGDLNIVDIMVIALRGGLTGREPLAVNETASTLGVGRGAVANAQKRFVKVKQ